MTLLKYELFLKTWTAIRSVEHDTRITIKGILLDIKSARRMQLTTMALKFQFSFLYACNWLGFRYKNNVYV